MALAMVILLGLFVCELAAQDKEQDGAEAARDKRAVEALMRLSSFDLDSRPDVKVRVGRYLETVKGTARFIEVVEKLKYTEGAPTLVEMAVTNPDDSVGVEAIRVLFNLGQQAVIHATLKGEEIERAAAMARVVGRIGNDESVSMLVALVIDSELAASVRTQAVRSLGKSGRGELVLMEMIESGDLEESFHFAASDVLHASRNPEIVQRIEKALPLPASANSEPLPPIATLVDSRGDANLGKTVFETVGTCIKCHKVDGEGKEVGPDLTEIGSKLSREALYESILDPSAGISHNYESFLVTTIDGTIVTGVLQSETDENVVLKDAEAIVHTIPQDDIEDFIKQKVSIMPAGLQKDMSVNQLVDLVEYLTTLRKTDE